MTQPASLRDKVCLITGPTQGIGRAATLAIAKLSPKLVLVVRDPVRGAELADEIRAAGNPNVELLIGDLSKQADVRRIASEFLARHDRLHLLVNNAGAIFMQRQLSSDGLEMTFALNHLGYFLLTNLLRDVLVKSAPARIVNVASRAHVRGTIAFDDLQAERSFGGWSAYSQSKLANILFTRELARRLAGTGVTANSLHPGVIATGFGADASGLLRLGFRLARPFFLTPEEGARTTVYLATSPEVEGVTGKYFARCKEAKPRPQALDDATARRLWEVSEALVRPRAAS